MGISGALNTAVSGLQAQSFALEQISGNIANSETIGYKRAETSFNDLVTDTSSGQQTPGGVTATTRATNDVQGSVEISDVDTFIALSGDGYFVVASEIGDVDGEPTFSDTDVYTRRGDFELDSSGYFVNGAGYYLQGLPIDQSTGNAAGSAPEPVQVENDFLAARPTTQIDYQLNLSSYPLTATADPDVAGSELLDATDYANDPTVIPATATDGFIQGSDVPVFLESSVAGGATTIYDAQGGPVNVQFRWAKTDTASTGGTDTWQLFYQSNSSATGTDPAWRSTDTLYTFNADGTLQSPVTDPLVDFQVGGTTVSDVRIRHDSTGLTQFSDPSGNAQLTSLGQNGYAAGELVGTAVNDSGRVTASYSNGQVIDIAEAAVATFNGDGALQTLDGGAFMATRESGDAILVDATNVIGSALENSNVDISDEFTKLIVTQQAYSAAAQVITAADEMMQEALGMLR
ncbi:MAG: flagellar hook-basal body complex protein [Devosiaceae bacterium]|nr:flagellar hook-basal body complex protein [Devosiaceae bacterium MH13]